VGFEEFFEDKSIALPDSGATEGPAEEAAPAGAP